MKKETTNKRAFGMKILLSNGINWIPEIYIYDVTKINDNMYRILFTSGGTLELPMKTREP